MLDPTTPLVSCCRRWAASSAARRSRARHALVPDAAGVLVGAAAEPDALEEAAGRAAPAWDAIDAVDDLNGRADYKRHLASLLLRRAVLDALREATAHA